MVPRSIVLAIGLYVVGNSLVPPDFVRAQEKETEKKKQVGFAIGLVSPGGTYAYVPERWGTLHVQLTNPTDRPLELMAATYFDGEPTLQYGRRAWVPARSRLETWHPVRLPKVASDGGKRYNFHTLVMDASQSQEVLLRSNSGYLQHDGTLRATDTQVVTGIIDGLYEANAPEADAASELVVAVRSGEQLDRYITSLGDRIFTPGEESLDTLDNLVIVHDRVLHDGAGLSAIRRWLYGGGRLWIMLDLVNPRVLEMLLGDEFKCELVDRVGLTTVAIESAGAYGRIGKTVTEYENPVELVRVITADVEMAFTVNGWPAAFWKTCGEGRLLVTTLGPRGWMRTRPPPDAQGNIRPADRGNAPVPPDRPPNSAPPVNPAPIEAPPQTVNPSKFVSLEPMEGLAAEFLKRRPKPLLPRGVLESRVQEYVGYSIPPRWLVVSLLVGFSLLLAAAGVALWRVERLEWLGLAGPVLALATSLALIGIGRAQRQAVAPTVASVQFVHAIAGTDDVRVDGVTGLYSPDTGTAQIGSTGGGWLLPNMTGLEGKTRRMIWNDLDQWQWENLPESAGLRMAEFQESGPLASRLEAHAQFGPQGLTGRLEAGGARDVSDAIIATRYGRIGVDLKTDGTFEARADEVFSPEQFLGAKFVLSDEQTRRRATLESLMPVPANEDDGDSERPSRPQNPREFPVEPTLLFWSAPWNIGFRFGADRRPDGAALVAVPLRFERPANGTEIVLPVPLLPFRAERGPDGSAPSGLYGNLSRVWNRKSFPASSTWLRYQIPPVLLPVQALQGRIKTRVKGPIGKLEIAGAAGNRVVPIKTWIDPVGGLTFDITDQKVLSVTEDGGLYLRLTGGDDSRPGLTLVDNGDGSSRTVYWKVEMLTLELTLKIVDPELGTSAGAGGG
ncbi:MAG: hypothetical protein EXS05_13670 [Planctomycetaceae bacterium]|nr:hypothetical protein [Planctomycetaceae bacterium]